MGGEKTCMVNDEKQKKEISEYVPEEAPEDHCFGWVVLISCIYTTMISTSITTTFGLMFGPMMKSMNMSNTLISWTFNLHFFIWNMDTCISGPLTQKFGWRVVGFGSAVMSGVIFALFPFVTSPVIFFLLYSIILGISSGISYHVTFILLPAYFHRRRGLAVCLNTAAVALSQMFVPQIIRLLSDGYGSQGAILIYSGILLNVCVAVALHRPLPQHSKQTFSESAKTDCGKSCAAQNITIVVSENGVVKDELFPEKFAAQKKSNGTSNKSEDNYLMIPQTRTRKNSEPHRSNTSKIFDDRMHKSEGNFLMVPELRNKTLSKRSLFEELNDIPEGHTEHLETCSDVIHEIKMYFLECIGSLRSPVVNIIGFSYGLHLVGYLNFHMLIPFILVEAGYTYDTASYCLSTFAISNLVARVVNALVSDRSWFSGAFVYVSGGVISAVFCLLFMASLESWSFILVFISVYGFGVGMTVSIFQLLVLETVGMDKYIASLGGTGIICAVMCLVVAPVLGVIRDHSTSFWYSMLIASGMQLSLSLIWALMPLARRYEARRSQQGPC